ncbi:hypothetical protein ACSBR1_031697 [Camellia fascicularis]
MYQTAFPTPYVCLLFIYVTKQSMASFMSTGTSTPWPRRTCACGYGQCVVKISRSHKNPRRAYYACPNPVPCLSWIGWCNEPRRLNTESDSAMHDIVMQLRDDVIHMQQTLRILKTIINKSCAKFRTKTLEHRELMEIVFIGAAATGRHHWTPGERIVEDNEGSSDSVQSLGMRPFTDPIPSVGIDVDTESLMETCGKSRKPTSGASAIADNVNILSNVVRTKNQEVTVRHLIGNESLYTISECMDRLKSIPALVGTLLFHFASSLMDNADYREVMMCQPDDDHIIGWLTQKQLQSSTAAPFAMDTGIGHRVGRLLGTDGYGTCPKCHTTSFGTHAQSRHVGKYIGQSR